MELQSYTERSVFDALRPEWNALLHDSEADKVFLTLEWQETWWESYHPGELWVVVGRDADGKLAGIAPWFIETKAGKRIVRTIGCADVTDYLELIARRDQEHAFFEALADCLSGAANEVFDLLDLCNIPEASPTLRDLPALLEARSFDVTVKQQEVCPIIALPASWEDFLAVLNKKNRHELRRKLRRAEGLTQPLDWYIVGPEHDLDAELERFLALMAASTEEKAQFLQDEQHVAFFKTIVPRIIEHGWLMLSFLTVDGEPVAAYLNFDYNNRILVYNSGQELENFGHLSPGIVLLAHNIRYAIDQGRDEFDFLRGNEEYKYRMGGQDTAVLMLMAERRPS